MLVVAVLETMWGAPEDGTEAPRYFKINPANHSGRRLYTLIGPDAKLLVTNACREYVTKANQHGKPDPEWLDVNLRLLDERGGRIDVLLLCGKVAQKTFERCTFVPARARQLCIPHPAARFVWTPELMERIAAEIRG